mmetsp:Transcript_5165/g.6603  ORF Transcript_5165/g.6603 Transcript_5165/m.6603 type:complete len:347 (-) Transcript_5165:154-1194(-)
MELNLAHRMPLNRRLASPQCPRDGAAPRARLAEDQHADHSVEVVDILDPAQDVVLIVRPAGLAVTYVELLQLMALARYVLLAGGDQLLRDEGGLALDDLGDAPCPREDVEAHVGCDDLAEVRVAALKEHHHLVELVDLAFPRVVVEVLRLRAVTHGVHRACDAVAAVVLPDLELEAARVRRLGPEAVADARVLVDTERADPVHAPQRAAHAQLGPQVLDVPRQQVGQGLVEVRLAQRLRDDGGNEVAEDVGPAVRHHPLRHHRLSHVPLRRQRRAARAVGMPREWDDGLAYHVVGGHRVELEVGHGRVRADQVHVEVKQALQVEAAVRQLQDLVVQDCLLKGRGAP